jgi:hypothetical protein
MKNKPVVNVNLAYNVLFSLQEFVLLKMGAERRKAFKAMSLHTR